MTVRMTTAQVKAYRKLSDEYRTANSLGEPISTLDALVRGGYADKRQPQPGWPYEYARGPKDFYGASIP
jgi:hypothetical protein